MRGFDNVLQRRQDSGMQRLIQLGNARITTINGQQILRKVIRTNR